MLLLLNITAILMFCSFYFICVNRNAGVFILRTFVSLRRLLFTINEKNRTIQTLQLRQHNFPLTHTNDTNTKHVVSSAKTAQTIKWRREGCCWGNWAQEHLFGLHDSHGFTPPASLPSCGTVQIEVSGFLNVEDELQRQLMQRQLAWTRKQSRAEGGNEGRAHGSAGPALCIYDRDRFRMAVWFCEWTDPKAYLWKCV